MTHKARVSPGLLLFILALATIASAEWNEKVLYAFQDVPDGATPVGGLVFDQAGNLYGATANGGSSSCAGPGQCGTVFQLAPPAKKGGSWTETVLYVFKGHDYNDGATPEGGLVIDSLGNLYGTTAYGGAGNCLLLGAAVGCGTVYELSPPAQKGDAWTETILCSFPTAKQGYFPWGDLVFDSAGNLYGATQFGGGHGTTCNGFYQYCGAIFELSPPETKGGKWTEKVLYGFKGVAPGAQFGDGANPNGGLILDDKGAIYGTTYFGGNNQKGRCEGGVGGTGCGIVFELAPPNHAGGKWTEKVLHQFNGQDGSNSAAGVVFNRKGNLYCTTAAGGEGNFPSGSIVQFVPQSNGKWMAHILHSFQDNGDGGQPRAGLVFDAKGNLYGTASGGGSFGGGTIFRLRPETGGSWGFTGLYDFKAPQDGSYPAARLVFDKSGNMYGITQYGGNGQACGHYGCGTVFEISPSNPSWLTRSIKTIFGP